MSVPLTDGMDRIKMDKLNYPTSYITLIVIKLVLETKVYWMCQFTEILLCFI